MGGWCRPQTDGPALRAMALSKWGMILINNGHSDQAKSDVWPLVNFDMEWAVANWDQQGTTDIYFTLFFQISKSYIIITFFS